MIIPRHRRHNGFAIVVICQQSYSTILVIIKKEPTTMSGLLIGYRLCVLASGSLITDIFNCCMLISVSCLHFGQNKGKCSSTVSSRIFNLVLLPQTGHKIHCSSIMAFFLLLANPHCWLQIRPEKVLVDKYLNNQMS